jgi:hypothetical protein
MDPRRAPWRVRLCHVRIIVRRSAGTGGRRSDLDSNSSTRVGRPCGARRSRSPVSRSRATLAIRPTRAPAGPSASGPSSRAGPAPVGCASAHEAGGAGPGFRGGAPRARQGSEGLEDRAQHGHHGQEAYHRRPQLQLRNKNGLSVGTARYSCGGRLAGAAPGAHRQHLREDLGVKVLGFP